MSFAANSYSGPASDYKFELQSPPEDQRHTLHDRAQRIIAQLGAKLEELVPHLGDTHVAVSASGHLQGEDGQQGDSLYVNVASLAPPEDAPAEQPAAAQEAAQATEQAAEAQNAEVAAEQAGDTGGGAEGPPAVL